MIEDLSHVKAEIRPFYERDLSQLKKIEKGSFVEYPWTEEDFIIFLRKLEKGHEAYVSEWREYILGFMLVSKNTWNYEIISLAVSPEFRRIGIGQSLIEFIKSKLIPYSREDIYARVRASNKEALQFFETQGFSIIDKYDKCYSDNNEGCYRLKYELVELPLKKEYQHL